MKMSPRIALLVAFMARTITCFVPLSNPSLASSRFMGNAMRLIPSSTQAKNAARSTTGSAKMKSSAMKMSFLGSDGGLLGIGAPEVAIIVLVGYFVLGPSDLYKLVKEIGKFIQNIRTLGVEATKTLEVSMESQLQFDEIRKAQRELNDAFSFRRTINTDDEADAFSATVTEPRPGIEPIAQSILSDSSSSDKKKKKVKRRKIQQPTQPPMEQQQQQQETTPTMNIPDLDINDSWMAPSYSETESWMTPEEAIDEDMLRKQRMQERLDRLSGNNSNDEDSLRQERMDRLARSSTAGQYEEAFVNPYANPLDAQNRFAEQLSGNWNAKIVANEEKLEPLALLMERLAILEEEKNAADARLEEEFRLRAQSEEKYYRMKRQILEDAAADVQATAYSDSTSL